MQQNKTTKKIKLNPLDEHFKRVKEILQHRFSIFKELKQCYLQVTLLIVLGFIWKFHPHITFLAESSCYNSIKMH